MAGNPVLSLSTTIALAGKTITGLAASSVTNTPAGSIAATNVQTALNELDTEKAALAGSTFTGQVITAAGSAAAPAIGPEADTGLYSYGANQLGFAAGGALVGYADANGLHVGATSSRAGIFSSLRTGGSDSTMSVHGESGFVGLSMTRLTGSTGAPFVRMVKGRGAWASTPAVASAGDDLGSIWFESALATTTDATPTSWPGVQIKAVARAAAFATTDAESELIFNIAGAGSGTPAETVAIRRSTGFAYDANVVIGPDRMFRDRVYTLGTLPAPGTAGRTAIISDSNGGPAHVEDNGTRWIRKDEGGYRTRTNVSYTIQVLADAKIQVGISNLTANRTVTLSTTDAYAGAEFVVGRSATATGAFNLDVGGLKTLTAAGQFCRVRYDGSAWQLVGYWTL